MTTRWTTKRKAAVVASVARGELPRAAAMRIHDLSEEELASWELLYAQWGEPGLRATRTQSYGRRRRRTN